MPIRQNTKHKPHGSLYPGHGICKLGFTHGLSFIWFQQFDQTWHIQNLFQQFDQTWHIQIWNNLFIILFVYLGMSGSIHKNLHSFDLIIELNFLYLSVDSTC